MQKDFQLKEQFKMLKELSSLFTQLESIQGKMTKETLRVDKIKDQRKKRELEKLELQNSLKEYSAQEQLIENQLVHSQGQLNQVKGHLNSVQTQQQIDALESEISKLENDINQFEENGIEVLEKIDYLHEKINEANNFLIGSKNSLEEIMKEVANINHGFQKDIDTLNLRINLLTEDLDPIFQSKLKSAISKKIQTSFFTRVNGEACDFCKLQLSKVEVDNIERKLSLVNCNGCHRIFIPLNSLY